VLIFVLEVLCCMVRGMSYAEVGQFAYIGYMLLCNIRADKMNFVCIVSALLVTGRSGARIISILQAVAKPLQ
jgi:hypothetical protein